MENSTRYHTAIPTVRPRGARLIEAYSQKLGRRLQCFGEDAFRQWICLEADPSIKTYCERPAYLDSGDKKRLADFWIRQEDSETMLVIGEGCQATTFTIDDVELPVRTVLPADLAASRIWISNWERMLPSIICCRQLISQSLINSTLKFVSEPMQVNQALADTRRRYVY